MLAETPMDSAAGQLWTLAGYNRQLVEENNAA